MSGAFSRVPLGWFSWVEMVVGGIGLFGEIWIQLGGASFVFIGMVFIL